MNALGLPGASIDGILGFTILARFRLEIDLTQDRMTWTRLAHEPRDPPVPKRARGENPPQPPLGVRAMSSLGSVAKGLALFVGKQPEEEQRGRGFLGLEWTEQAEAGRQEVEVSRVLTGSPASGGGLQAGDRIKKINSREIEGIKGARAALATAQPGDVVRILVRRGSGTRHRDLELELTVGEGL